MPQTDTEKVLADAVTRGFAPLVERMNASEEKAKKMDERVEALAGEIGEAAKRSYMGALQRGNPFTAQADEGVDAYLERLLEEERERQVVNAVATRGSTRTQVRNRKGLDAVRILRAGWIAQKRTGKAEVNHDEVLNVLRSWGDTRTAGLVENHRDEVKRYRETTDVAERGRIERALGSTLVGSGGGFVTAQTWGSFIDFLWPKTTVRALGAMTVPLSKNSITIPFIDTAAGASYRGQLQNAAITQFTEKLLQLTLKLL